jgi:hypothetical protein
MPFFLNFGTVFLFLVFFRPESGLVFGRPAFRPRNFFGSGCNSGPIGFQSEKTRAFRTAVFRKKAQVFQRTAFRKTSPDLPDGRLPEKARTFRAAVFRKKPRSSRRCLPKK